MNIHTKQTSDILVAQLFLLTSPFCTDFLQVCFQLVILFHFLLFLHSSARACHLRYLLSFSFLGKNGKWTGVRNRREKPFVIFTLIGCVLRASCPPCSQQVRNKLLSNQLFSNYKDFKAALKLDLAISSESFLKKLQMVGSKQQNSLKVFEEERE